MTTLDDIDLWPPAEPRELETRRKCSHPRHRRRSLEGGGSVCTSCGREIAAVSARRGRQSRNRGNAFEREVAVKLGGRRVGQYGDSVDVQVDGWLRVQTKNGGAYPALLDRWLRAIPFQADLLRAVVVGDAPGPGHPRKALIVLDLGEFSDWYGKR